MVYGPIKFKGAIDFEQHVTLSAPQATYARLGIGTDMVLRWVDPNGVVYEAGSRNELIAHINETDPIAHTASRIQSTLGNVQTDLDDLDANKVDNSALNATLKAIASSGTTINKNTTATEQDLFSFTLPANSLAQDGDMLLIDAAGDILANSGAPTWTWKIKNGAVILDTPASAVAINSNQRRWKLVVSIIRLTGVSQSIAATLFVSQASANVFALTDPLHSWVGDVTNFANTDFSQPSIISFTVQMSVSNANNRTRMYGYNARKVRGAV